MFSKCAVMASVLMCCASVWGGNVQASPYVPEGYEDIIQASGRNSIIRDIYTRRYQGLIIQNASGLLSDPAYVDAVISLARDARLALANATAPARPTPPTVQNDPVSTLIVLEFETGEPTTQLSPSEVVRNLTNTANDIPGGVNGVVANSQYNCSYADSIRDPKACYQNVTYYSGLKVLSRGNVIEQGVPSFLGDFTRTALVGKLAYTGPLLVLVTTYQTLRVDDGANAVPGMSFLDVQLLDPGNSGVLASALLQAPIEDAPEPASLFLLAGGVAAASMWGRRRMGLRQHP